MADFDRYAPTLLRVECSWRQGFPSSWASVGELFEAARKGAYCNIDGDKGGPTFAGVTLATYRSFYGTSMTVHDLRNMAYHEWRNIYKTGYWDVMKADEIDNQSVADLCVDWLVNSGVGKVRNIQRVLGVQADGKVGPKTLAAINGACPMCLHKKLYEARKAYYRSIATGSNAQFLVGWLNRLSYFEFSTR